LIIFVIFECIFPNLIVLNDRKRYILWLVEKVGVSRAYELTRQHYTSNCGAGLLSMYKGSPGNILDSVNYDDDDEDEMFMVKKKVREEPGGFRGNRPRNYWVLFPSFSRPFTFLFN
jgi:hypothetical protein